MPGGRQGSGKPTKTGSTPAVVPGAAPALAKAGVGGFRACDVTIHRYARDAYRNIHVKKGYVLLLYMHLVYSLYANICIYLYIFMIL